MSKRTCAGCFASRSEERAEAVATIDAFRFRGIECHIAMSLGDGGTGHLLAGAA